MTKHSKVGRSHEPNTFMCEIDMQWQQTKQWKWILLKILALNVENVQLQMTQTMKGWLMFEFFPKVSFLTKPESKDKKLTTTTLPCSVNALQHQLCTQPSFKCSWSKPLAWKDSWHCFKFFFCVLLVFFTKICHTNHNFWSAAVSFWHGMWKGQLWNWKQWVLVVWALQNKGQKDFTFGCWSDCPPHSITVPLFSNPQQQPTKFSFVSLKKDFAKTQLRWKWKSNLLLHTIGKWQLWKAPIVSMSWGIWWLNHCVIAQPHNVKNVVPANCACVMSVKVSCATKDWIHQQHFFNFLCRQCFLCTMLTDKNAILMDRQCSDPGETSFVGFAVRMRLLGSLCSHTVVLRHNPCSITRQQSLITHC